MLKRYKKIHSQSNENTSFYKGSGIVIEESEVEDEETEFTPTDEDFRYIMDDMPG